MTIIYFGYNITVGSLEPKSCNDFTRATKDLNSDRKGYTASYSQCKLIRRPPLLQGTLQHYRKLNPFCYFWLLMSNDGLIAKMN